MYNGYKEIPQFHEKIIRFLGKIKINVTKEEIDYSENAPLGEKQAKFEVKEWANLDAEKTITFENIVFYKTVLQLIRFELQPDNPRIKEVEDFIKSLISQITKVEDFIGFMTT